jgi:hypothetical protein
VDDSLDEDSRQVHVSRRNRPRFDEFVHLSDRDPPGHRTQRVEVAGRLVKDQVAVSVTAQGVYEREVGDDGSFQDVAASVEPLHWLARRGRSDRSVRVVAPGHPTVGNISADTGRCEERCHAAAAGTQTLGQRALRHEFNFKLTVEVLASELLVVTNIGADDTSRLAGLQQLAETYAVDAAIVRHEFKLVRVQLQQTRDQGGGNAAEAEPADRDARSGLDSAECLGDRSDGLVH